MLFADKRALETNLQVSLLKIREKELREPPRCAILAAGTCRTLQCKTAHRAALPRAAAEFYTQNCIAIGTQAALLSGFAYNGIIQVDIPEESSDVLKALYLCVTTAAMGFELIAVLNSTLCSMLGPGLALRGQPEREQQLHGIPCQERQQRACGISWWARQSECQRGASCSRGDRRP